MFRGGPEVASAKRNWSASESGDFGLFVIVLSGCPSFVTLSEISDKQRETLTSATETRAPFVRPKIYFLRAAASLRIACKRAASRFAVS